MKSIFESSLLAGIVSVALLGGCSSAPEVARPSPFGVYSTAYLTEDNQVVRMAEAGAKKTAPKPTPKPEWTWHGDGVLGAPSLVIDLSDQKVIFYKNGNPVGSSPVSTGREGFKTPSGSFKIVEKNKDHISSLYGDFVDAGGQVVVANVDVSKDKCPAGAKFRGAPMPFFMRVNGGVGLHAGYLPGYPASHGCIRMPRAAAHSAPFV
jgi:hypothetical protein